MIGKLSVNAKNKARANIKVNKISVISFKIMKQITSHSPPGEWSVYPEWDSYGKDVITALDTAHLLGFETC